MAVYVTAAVLPVRFASSFPNVPKLELETDTNFLVLFRY